MTDAPEKVTKAAPTDAQIAMSAAWLVVAFLDRGSGPRRQFSDEFKDALKILTDELAAAKYLERYRDPATGALHLPPLLPSANRAEKFGPEDVDSDGTVSRIQLKGIK